MLGGGPEDEMFGRHERVPPKDPGTGPLQPLHLAAADNAPALRELLAAGTEDLERKALKGWTPLIFAARSGNLEAVNALLDAGADIHAVDHHGSTALHRAAFGGHRQVIRALVDAAAELEATDRYGRTALHVAADAGEIDSTRCLLKLGANTRARDGPLKDGQTPIEVARVAHNDAVATVLEAKEVRRLRLAGGATMLVRPEYVHCPFR